MKYENKIPSVDKDLSLYELTDLVYAYHNYHENDSLFDYHDYFVGKNNEVRTRIESLSRFQSLRKVEATYLGSRPFFGGKGITPTRPNISLGYMRYAMDLTSLPIKALLNEKGLAKIVIDKRHYIENKLAEEEQEALEIAGRKYPSIISSKEISDDVSDVFDEVLRLSTNMKKCFATMPRWWVQDGVVAFLHSDVDWVPEPIKALDLITEPMAHWDTSSWNMFFVVKKMCVSEVRSLIKSPGKFWNAEALRWALENALDRRSIFNDTWRYTTSSPEDETCGENFFVKSFYKEKADRITNLNAYYGSFLVIEAYYTNTEGKVDKCIFFPSSDFLDVPSSKRDFESDYVLFKRNNVFDDMSSAITIIPFDRSELTLERQRGFGQELFSTIEAIMRLDTSILNYTQLLSTPFYKDQNMGKDAQTMSDMELAVNGDMQDLGTKEFVEVPIKGDLQSLLTTRNILLQYLFSKAFIGGLDNTEATESGRGAQKVNQMLLRDGRVQKHNVASFVEGLTELFTVIFRRILKLNKKLLINDDVLLKKTFFDKIFKVLGHDEDIFDFSSKDIVPDTGLPYWISVQATMNGASYFGAAELVLYSQIKQIFGDGLTQAQLQSLNRMGIKSLLGTNDALDILGDPKDLVVTEQEQVYRASLENASLLGSVDGGALNFEDVPALDLMDDHVAHLTQVHIPKAMEIIEILSQGDNSPQDLQEQTEETLDTRVNLTLKLASLSSHMAMHASNLDRFGSKRPDINNLKEQTNAVLQTSEALLNNLQVTLRALEARRAERELRLRNISPENEAEKAKQQTEMMKIQAQREATQAQLATANRIAQSNDIKHRDTQISKARDRQANIEKSLRDYTLKLTEMNEKFRLEEKKLNIEQAIKSKESKTKKAGK